MILIAALCSNTLQHFLSLPRCRASRAQPDDGPVKADYTFASSPFRLSWLRAKRLRLQGITAGVSGPVLRLREGRPVSINVINDAGYPDIVHWHGLYLPAVQDGATEEGSPIIPLGHSQTLFLHAEAVRHALVSQPRHGMTDLTSSTYSGEFGFLLIEPAAGDPGRYDREVLLAARHWEGSWVSMQDIHEGPPPDNGLEVMYHSATLGERMLGHDEPIRVRAGRARSLPAP